MYKEKLIKGIYIYIPIYIYIHIKGILKTARLTLYIPIA